MSETKHTPGPWVVKSGRSGFYVQSQFDVIVESLDEFGRYGAIDDEANARLIAAAPELLEALYIVDACGEPKPVELYDGEAEGWEWVHPDGREWHEIGIWEDGPPMHPAARAAIAKAKGEQP